MAAFLYLPATGRIQIIITKAKAAATENRVLPENAEISRADRNCPANMAIVQKLILSPLFAGVLLLTMRLLKRGVEHPKPIPAKNTAIQRITAFPERKYRRNAIP